jgi:hypothetical protein
MLKMHSYSHFVYLLVVEPVSDHDEIDGLLDNFEIVS